VDEMASAIETALDASGSRSSRSLADQ
jgi:hypothetical protein